MTPPLTREAIARFLARPDRPRVVHRKAARRKAAKPAPKIRPSNPIRIAAEFIKRFTTSDLMRLTGKDRPKVAATVSIMRRMGLVRKVSSEQTNVAIYQRIDGGDMSGRIRNDGARLIEAMAPGHTFTRADLLGTPSQISEAILRTRKCGLIRRISPRQTCAVWEVVT